MTTIITTIQIQLKPKPPQNPPLSFSGMPFTPFTLYLIKNYSTSLVTFLFDPLPQNNSKNTRIKNRIPQLSKMFAGNALFDITLAPFFNRVISVLSVIYHIHMRIFVLPKKTGATLSGGPGSNSNVFQHDFICPLFSNNYHWG